MWFDSIDAAIFSGDEFLNAEAIKEAKQYFKRWNRELTVNAQICFEQKLKRHRIACKSSKSLSDWRSALKEALYPTIEAFEKDTGLKFKDMP
jgi:hypothetical protein